MIQELKIQDVVNEWKSEATINETSINTEICRTPNLHSKYLGYYVTFKNDLSRAESAYYRMGSIKRKYYRGECTQEELKKFGWEQFQGLKPSSTEMAAHLDFDTDMIKLREHIADKKSAVATMEYILKSIAGREWSIKTLFEYNKYINGG